MKVFSLSLFTSYQCDYLFLEILIFLEILELFNKKKEKKRKKKEMYWHQDADIDPNLL